jgi:hypothetical protein
MKTKKDRCKCEGASCPDNSVKARKVSKANVHTMRIKAPKDAIVEIERSEVTKTPWILDSSFTQIEANDGTTTTTVVDDSQMIKADAELIVRAVNAYESLLNVVIALDNCLRSKTIEGQASDYLEGIAAKALKQALPSDGRE